MYCNEINNIIPIQSVDDHDLRNKLEILRKLFKERTATDIRYVVRAPGRINLIGDHIDYHGFSVLPMAIEHCIWLGCSVLGQRGGENQVRIFNEKQVLYPDAVYDHSLTLGCRLDQSHQWQNYILCGYHGILTKEILRIQPCQVLKHTKSLLEAGEQDLIKQDFNKLKNLPSFNLMVMSDLPPASGLSSSSALVCASAVASYLLLQGSNQQSVTYLDSKQMAEDCSKFEHLIGTHGGGMDQAVIMTAHKGYAKYVEFLPHLSFTDVELPNDVVWLVSHCGSDYPKAATAGFNSRVLETKLGAAMMAKYLSNEDTNISLDNTVTLGKVKQIFLANQSTESIISLLREKIFLHDKLCFKEICTALEIGEDDLLVRFATTKEFIDENLQDSFPLKQRCEHVFEEAERVHKFREICDTTRDCKVLGTLMTESHISLRDKYQCSHPALDKLVEISLEAGALGARVTGAGWGGCIVAMVKSDKCNFVLEKLKQASKFAMITAPQSGCTIVEF